MTAKRYRKKPVEVMAFEFTGDNGTALKTWAGPGVTVYPGTPDRVIIYTKEGELQAKPGDFIICGTAGEFYPCKPDIFATIYEGPLE